MWDHRFESIVRDHLPHLRPEAPLTPDLLLSAHGLDSMGVFGLITDLEEAYAVALPDEAVTPANFATPHTVWEMLLPLVPVEHDGPAA